MSGEKTDPQELVPSIKDWPTWEDMTPADWAGAEGTYEHAIGYSFYFWPEFIAVGDYVLRADPYEPENLRSWEKATDNNRQAIEAVLNHVHICDLHSEGEPSETQVRYLGRTLKEMLEAKLARDFPDRSFEVDFNDEPGLDLIDYQVTFWQSGEKE